MLRVANFILNDLPMGSAKKLGVINKNLSISPIGLLIMTRLLIFIWQKCHGVGNVDWVLYLAVKSKSADTLIVCPVFATMVFKNDKVLDGNKCSHSLLYLVNSLNLP